MRSLLVLLVLVLAGGVAAADDPAPTTMLVGRVTDVLGKPIGDARVYLLPRGGGRLQTVTDKDGRYAIGLADGGAYSVVIAVGRVHTYRQVLIADRASTTLDVEVETDIAGGEVINIIDRKLPAPAIPPRPTNDNGRKSLPYSPQAMERDAWARAFLLLDIDEKGEVSRLKLLKRPGFDLDQIAIDEAFKLKFEPARDAKGRPIRTYIVWDMEWPSWGWLVQGNGTAAGRPSEHNEIYRNGRLDTAAPLQGDLNPQGGFVTGPDEPGNTSPNVAQSDAGLFARPLPITPITPLNRVPCAGSGPLNLDLQNRAYRDCSRPDLTNIDALPWITRANAKTALATLDSNKPQVIPGPPRSKVGAWIATGVTVAMTAGLVGAYVEYDKYSNTKHELIVGDPDTIEARERDVKRLQLWNHRVLEMAGLVVVSGAVTAFMWGRAQTRESFSVQPTAKGTGATVSWGRSF